MYIYRFLKLETLQTSQVGINMIEQLEVTLYKYYLCHMPTDQPWLVIKNIKKRRLMCDPLNLFSTTTPPHNSMTERQEKIHQFCHYQSPKYDQNINTCFYDYNDMD